MKIQKLQSHLSHELESANEVSIASAIVSQEGLNYLFEKVSNNCKVRLLIGIDLPTPDLVFKQLFSMNNPNIDVRVFTKQGFFHPKLYLVEGDSNTAFIGSGNFTEGGLKNNIELFHKISDDAEFSEYKDWFNLYFKFGDELTKDWIEEYSIIYNERKEFEAADKRRIGNFKKRLSGIIPVLDIYQINFHNQFFKLNHYLAFEGDKPNNRAAEVNRERFEVKEKLMELHELVWPLIEEKKWDLHPHSMAQHIVSSYQHGEHTGDDLTALWLHYGRSQYELDLFAEDYGENQTSLYHMRLQVLVHLNDISVWLRVGKNNGSIVDREAFKQSMKLPSYKINFYNLIKALPNDFSISINDEWKGVNSFQNENDLYNFVKNDDIRNHYFIIGRVYLPNAIEISEQNIAKTVVDDFEKLLPLYNLIKTVIYKK